jgi:DNA-binding NarL/FixJ family response regulator
VTIRVIIVDDHDAMRRSIARFLATATDVEVVAETGSSLEALELCASQASDVVLLDVRMREIDGIELTRRLRKAGCTAGIIGLSMYGRREIRSQMMDAGANAYVDKMAPPAELLSLVRQCAESAAQRLARGGAPGAGSPGS